MRNSFTVRVNYFSTRCCYTRYANNANVIDQKDVNGIKYFESNSENFVDFILLNNPTMLKSPILRIANIKDKNHPAYTTCSE